MSSKGNAVNQIEYPELVIGIAGPIGVDIDKIVLKISTVLNDLRYSAKTIHLTKEMEKFGEDNWTIGESNKFAIYNAKMDYANKLRKKFQSPDTLARIAVQSIREIRRSETGDVKVTCAKTAYIIRQLKLPEEVRLLRKIYGRQFILISAYGNKEDRKLRLTNDIKKSMPTDTSGVDIKHHAEQLIDRDQHEENDLGQNLGDTFHMADVFIDGIAAEEMENTIERFFRAFFGSNEITPTKDEFGMYLAKSASLRSADLSRQVGAAIVSKDGDVITQSCNEVAKYLGGNYWDGETPDYRDIKIGHDPNDELKKEVLKNIIERLSSKGFLSSEVTNIGSAEKILEKLTDKNDPNFGVLSDSKVMDLTEFGRVVHAEMNSICDAARLGRSVQGTSLYCTTFPCHNCTKHIISVGIKKVVYMEPYPKSRAQELFGNEIEIETESDPKKVSFIPFLGISPFRYRDIFQKGKRKSGSSANAWYQATPMPYLDVEFPSYPTTTEPWAISKLIGEVG